MEKFELKLQECEFMIIHKRTFLSRLISDSWYETKLFKTAFEANKYLHQLKVKKAYMFQKIHEFEYQRL